MKTIVVPTDFNAVAYNAAEYAADLAVSLDAGLALIYVCPVPSPFNAVPVPEQPAHEIEALMYEASQRMGLLKERIEKYSGCRIRISTEIRQGDMVRELDEYCISLNAWLIVMSAEQEGALNRLLFGERTIEVIRKLPWTVITVPPGRKFNGFRKIGLACDLNDVEETIPQKMIYEFVKTFGATLHVLHIGETIEDIVQGHTVNDLRWVRFVLRDLEPAYHFINDQHVDENIIDFVERNVFDLLMIIPKHHNVIEQAFKHSHSKGIVLHARLPVMALHKNIS